MRMAGPVLFRGVWAERPAVVPQGVRHSTPSLGDFNPTLDELKGLLGTTLEVREASGNGIAANWFSEDGELVRWVAGHPSLVNVVLDLLATRTSSDLGIEVSRPSRVLKEDPRQPG